MITPKDEEYTPDEEDEVGPFGTNANNLEELARHALSRLEHETGPDIDVQDYSDLQEVILELNGWGSSAYNTTIAQQLGFQPSVINKFLKHGGKVRLEIARKLADRTITFMRSQQTQAVSVPVMGRIGEPPPPREPEFALKATEWVLVRQTGILTEQISQLIVLIGEVAQHATTSNLPSDQRALTAIERAQLIAVLETALNMLKSPMVEKGLLRKTKAMLKRAAAKAMEKQVEIAFTTAASAAGTALGVFLSHI